MANKNLNDLAEGLLRPYKKDLSDEGYRWLKSVAKKDLNTFLDFVILVEDRERRRIYNNFKK